MLSHLFESLSKLIPYYHLSSTKDGEEGGRLLEARCLPEIVPPAELPAQFVVEAPAHLAEAAAAQVTAETVLMPVLVDGLQEIAVPNVLLAAPTCQQ